MQRVYSVTSVFSTVFDCVNCSPRGLRREGRQAAKADLPNMEEEMVLATEELRAREEEKLLQREQSTRRMKIATPGRSSDAQSTPRRKAPSSFGL